MKVDEKMLEFSSKTYKGAILNRFGSKVVAEPIWG